MKAKWFSLVLLIMGMLFTANASAATPCTLVFGPDAEPDRGTPAPFNAVYSNFTPFNLKTNFVQDVDVCDPTRDFWLTSVEYTVNKQLVKRSDFMLVGSTEVINNVFGPPGAREPNCVISIGRGAYAKVGAIEGCVDARLLLEAYNNLNLSSINFNRELGSRKKVEEQGKSPDIASFTLSFPQPTNRFLIYERGMDSDIRIAALDAQGKQIATAYIPRPKLDYNAIQNPPVAPSVIQFTGINLYTRMSGSTAVGPQSVGSVGLKLSEGVTSDKLLIWTYPNPDFGPDYKIIALAPEQPKEQFDVVHCHNNYEAQKITPPPGGGSASIKKKNSGDDRLVDISATLNGALASTTFDIFLHVDGKWASQKVGSVTTDKTGHGTFSTTTTLARELSTGPHYLGLILTQSGTFNDVYETAEVHKNRGAIVQLK